MNVRTLVLLICFAACSGTNVIAQSAITFMGGTLEGSAISLSFTAGEAISGTFSSSNMSLTGGFQTGGDSTATSDELLPDLPKVFKLNQNYPNPFNPSTTISFDLPKMAHVQLEVYNSVGAKVAVLIDEQKAAGSYTHRFNASYLASGMYFYRLSASGKVISTKKMILIK